MFCIKMRLQFWNLKLGNKGFIFTLDMIIAMTFTIIILILANYYVRATEQPLSKLQIEKTGSDIVALLDNKGVLDSLSTNQIRSYLEDLVPVNYNMTINILTKNGVNLNIGYDLPNDRFIISGKRVFVVSQGDEIIDHGKLQYWIWLK